MSCSKVWNNRQSVHSTATDCTMYYRQQKQKSTNISWRVALSFERPCGCPRESQTMSFVLGIEAVLTNILNPVLRIMALMLRRGAFLRLGWFSKKCGCIFAGGSTFLKWYYHRQKCITWRFGLESIER